MLSGISKIPHVKFSMQKSEIKIPAIASAVPMQERRTFAQLSTPAEALPPPQLPEYEIFPPAHTPRRALSPEGSRPPDFAISVFSSFNPITINYAVFSQAFTLPQKYPY